MAEGSGILPGSPAARWSMLALFSAMAAWLLSLVHLPAVLLLGPLIAAAAMAACGRQSNVPAPPFRIAHAMVGAMIAKQLPPSFIAEFLLNWPLFVGGAVGVIVVSSGLGWLLARWRVLPGTTAIWGAAPGAASAILVMASGFGADVRLVAFMQYLRMVTVVLLATIVARLWVGEAAGQMSEVAWFPSLDGAALAATVTLVLFCAYFGPRLGIPAGALMLPLFGGALLANLGLLRIELPPWLMAPAYVLVGWQVGSRFDRPILLHAMRVLPQLLIATLVLVAACAMFAMVLVVEFGIDPLTAYLATSPGGVDSIAILGLSSSADMPFVMAMQTTRFVLVMVTGPWIARHVAALAERPGAA